jgi:exosome complex component RRP42
MILDDVKASFVKEQMSKGKRVDSRNPTEFRTIKVEKNVIENAEGSAIAHIGKTKVLAAVKFDLMAPFSDRPDEGVLMVGAEFPPLAHPSFESGPPREDSIELARVVDRGLRSAEVINLKKLGEAKSTDGRVMGVFLDIYVMDHNGNLTDAAALACMAALSCTKVPKLSEEGKLVRNDFSGPLELTRKSLTVTFDSIGGALIVDATDEEEAASDGTLTFGVTDDGLLCAGQKSGSAGFSRKQLLECADASLQLSKDLFKYV